MIYKIFIVILCLFSVGLFGERPGMQGPFTADFFDLPEKSIVEGSKSFGGTQPDYKLELNSPVVQEYLKYCSEVGNNTTLTRWEKIEKIQSYLSTKLLVDRRYQGKAYQALLKKQQDQPEVNIGEYAEARAGVCREHAILTHFGLKRAGIPNYYAYVKVEMGMGGLKLSEDHALNVIELDKPGAKPGEKEKWVVDSYSTSFNGYRFDDLVKGLPESSQASPLARHVVAKQALARKILKVLDYPLVWVPEGSELKGIGVKKVSEPTTLPLVRPAQRSSFAHSMIVNCGDVFRYMHWN